MSMNQKIIGTLSDFGFPVAPDMYVGEKETYFVFQYSTSPDNFADDEPKVERYLLQIHFYCPPGKNVLQIRTKIKQNLFAVGFSWPDEVNASDQDGQHYVFECETVEGVELYGEI